MKRILAILLLLAAIPISGAVLLVVSAPEATDWEPNANTVLFDDFEYAVSADPGDAAANTAAFTSHGTPLNWNNVKANNTGQPGSYGYLSTVTSIPGFVGSFPGVDSSTVLRIYSAGGTNEAQTDHYLEMYDGGSDVIPADAWFQFWIYVNYYGSELSQWDEGKFIYACNGSYGCHTHLWLWEFSHCNFTPPAGYEGTYTCPYGPDNPTHGELFLEMRAADGVSTIDNGNPDSPSNIGLNLDESEYIPNNAWRLLKIHLQTTATTGNKLEGWIRSVGGSFTKFAEWEDGVTVWDGNTFVWTVPSGDVGGHTNMRMPTTVGHGGASVFYDSWIYMDDFTVADDESGLPTYND